MTRTVACIVSAALATACGKSPAAPSPPAAVTLSGFSAGALGAAGNIAYGANFTLTETTGKAGFTINPPVYTLDDGSTITQGTIATHIAAGQTMSFTRNTFFDMSGRPLSSQMKVTISFTDDNGHTGTVSASTFVILPPVAFTIAGVVTDGTSGGALPRVPVRVTVGPGSDVGKAGNTDDNGYYSLSTLDTGFLTLSVSAIGYVTTTQSLILSRDTRLDFVLPREGSGPAPPPMPFPTGTCPAAPYPPSTTAICVDGTRSQSQTRAGACVSNQGVACWICPGVLCQ